MPCDYNTIHMLNMWPHIVSGHSTTSEILSFVGEWESAHAKLEARTALRYVQCGLHIYIYI